MKITIQKREPDKNGHRALRLVYYHGSKTGQNGSRAQKRSYEPLNLFLYDKPRLPAEREHNKTVNQKAEAIRAKRLLEIESSRHGLDDRTKLSASFFDYFDQLTDEKASGSKSNNSIWISTRHHLHRYHGLSELTFEQVDKRFLEYAMREVVLIAQPMSEPDIDTPALFELDPAMGSSGHSAQSVLCVSDTALMEDVLLAQGIADHKGHAVAIDFGVFKRQQRELKFIMPVTHDLAP